MKKYIEINWLQDFDIIQRNVLSPYIYNINDVTNNCDLYLYLYYYKKFIYENASFNKNIKYQFLLLKNFIKY